MALTILMLKKIAQRHWKTFKTNKKNHWKKDIRNLLRLVQLELAWNRNAQI